MRRVSLMSSWKKNPHICWWESTIGVKLAFPLLTTPSSAEANWLPLSRASNFRKLYPVSIALKVKPPGPGLPF